MDLEKQAAQIPSMNADIVSKYLREYASSSPEQMSIVEIGTWLGAATAQMALGVLERENQVPIHSYDIFLASDSESKKAADWDIQFQPGDDTRPVVEGLLQDFPVEIKLHKENLFDIKWSNEPIGLYVDDAAKSPSAFYQMMETFSPFWVPGQTIVALLDYNYWKKIKNEKAQKRYRVQRSLIEKYEDCFTPLASFEPSESSAAFFRFEKPFPLQKIHLHNKVTAVSRLLRLRS